MFLHLKIKFSLGGRITNSIAINTVNALINLVNQELIFSFTRLDWSSSLVENLLQASNCMQYINILFTHTVTQISIQGNFWK